MANGITILKVPQVRVLAVLLPDDGKWPPLGAVSRFELAAAAGFEPTTGTINRVLNGIPQGSSSGVPHLGLVELGFVERMTLDFDGVTRDCYRITVVGAEAVKAWLASNELPVKRDNASCVNKRYAGN